MTNSSLSEDDLKSVLINPFYAITISGDLMGEHKPSVSKAQWVDANGRLIEEIGAKAWLEKLLAVLQGDFPHGTDNEEMRGDAHTSSKVS